MKILARLLVIEDDPLDRALILDQLAAATYLHVDVALAESQAQALEALANRTFDLVLLDYRLPDGTAEPILNYLYPRDAEGELLESTSAAMPPDVLMLSAVDDLHITTRTMRSGALDFLSKRALESEEMARAVQAALLGRAHRAERYQRRMVEVQLAECHELMQQKGVPTLRPFSGELSDEQATTLRGIYRDFLRISIFNEDRGNAADSLIQYVHQQRIDVIHLIRLHTTMVEELVSQEPMMAQRALTKGRLALIRALLALVQKYQAA
ncbi:MAG: response regulator [Chloroflexaceae bacterium]|jgi:DNA-binding NarL/FixJ family response regulator|nr:response regulator [Chloroflexaceae bacterium]